MKITQKQLIKDIMQLKEIKPREEWALLLKSTLLENKVPSRMTGAASAQKVSIIDVLSSVFFQPFGSAQGRQKLAYAFAAILLLIVGVFGFAQNTMPGDLLFPIKKIAEQSQAALTGQTTLKQDVVNLNSRINDLAQVAKDGRKNNIPSAISEINTNLSQLAKSLKDNPAQDSKTLKEIAVSLKMLANVPGTDLSENQDVKDLYQTIVQSQIADLQKTTLTDEQKSTLIEIKELYEDGKYVEALEKILLISR